MGHYTTRPLLHAAIFLIATPAFFLPVNAWHHGAGFDSRRQLWQVPMEQQEGTSPCETAAEQF